MRPKHPSRPKLTFAERQRYHRILADEVRTLMEQVGMGAYELHKGSGVDYYVIQRMLKGCETKYWVVCAIRDFFASLPEGYKGSKK